MIAGFSPFLAARILSRRIWGASPTHRITPHKHTVYALKVCMFSMY